MGVDFSGLSETGLNRLNCLLFTTSLVLLMLPLPQWLLGKARSLSSILQIRADDDTSSLER